jgi:hypothetical protein
MPPGPDRTNRRRAYCGVVVPVPPVVPPIDLVVEVPPIVPVVPVPPSVPVVEPVPVPVVPLIEPPVVEPVPVVPPIDPSVEPVAGVVVLVELSTPVLLPCVPARLLRPRLDERLCVVVVPEVAEESVGDVVVCPPIDPEVPPIVELPVLPPVVVWA